MKSKTLMLATLLMTLACSHEEKKPKEYEVMKNTAEESAEVTSIDYKTRKMTMNTSEGPVSIVAGPEVKNFNQIKKGDTVVAQYQEALVYTIAETGEAIGAQVSSDVKTAKPGEQPGASSKTELTSSLEITKIDRDEPSVTLKNVSGETQKFKVAHPERLKGVDVGDIVNVKYSEAMAVKVEKKEKTI